MGLVKLSRDPANIEPVIALRAMPGQRITIGYVSGLSDLSPCLAKLNAKPGNPPERRRTSADHGSLRLARLVGSYCPVALCGVSSAKT